MQIGLELGFFSEIHVFSDDFHFDRVDHGVAAMVIHVDDEEVMQKDVHDPCRFHHGPLELHAVEILGELENVNGSDHCEPDDSLYDVENVNEIESSKMSSTNESLMNYFQKTMIQNY